MTAQQLKAALICSQLTFWPIFLNCFWFRSRRLRWIHSGLIQLKTLNMWIINCELAYFPTNRCKQFYVSVFNVLFSCSHMVNYQFAISRVVTKWRKANQNGIHSAERWLQMPRRGMVEKAAITGAGVKVKPGVHNVGAMGAVMGISRKRIRGWTHIKEGFRAEAVNLLLKHVENNSHLHVWRLARVTLIMTQRDFSWLNNMCFLVAWENFWRLGAGSCSNGNQLLWNNWRR